MLPLRIFESRYLDMIAACMRRDSGFGVCLIRRGSEVGPAADFFSVGTYARIIHWEQHQDGILGLTVQGEERFKVVASRAGDNQLIQGNVNWLEKEKSVKVPASHAFLKEIFEELSARLDLPQVQDTARYDEASWLGYRLAEILPITTAEKQELLEIDDSIERLNRVNSLIADLRGRIFQ